MRFLTLSVLSLSLSAHAGGWTCHKALFAASLLVAPPTFAIAEQIHQEPAPFLEGATLYTLEDGPVTCIIYSGKKKGGISCNATNDIVFEDLEPHRIQLTPEDLVVRAVVSGQLCYIYEGREASGISCLLPNPH